MQKREAELRASKRLVEKLKEQKSNIIVMLTDVLNTKLRYQRII